MKLKIRKEGRKVTWKNKSAETINIVAKKKHWIIHYPGKFDAHHVNK